MKKETIRKVLKHIERGRKLSEAKKRYWKERKRLEKNGKKTIK